MKANHIVLTVSALAFPACVLAQPAVPASAAPSAQDLASSDSAATNDCRREFVRGRHGHEFIYHGRHFHVIHRTAFIWPHGYAYRHWERGAFLPAIFLADAYFFLDYEFLGLEAPPPGDRWVRYGPDLVLVNLRTGRIDDIIYDAFE